MKPKPKNHAADGRGNGRAKPPKKPAAGAAPADDLGPSRTALVASSSIHDTDDVNRLLLAMMADVVRGLAPVPQVNAAIRSGYASVRVAEFAQKYGEPDEEGHRTVRLFANPNPKAKAAA